MIRLGITADLSPNGSIHQQTFIRAIKLGYEYLNLKEQGIELLWENDHATADGGMQAAKNLIHQGADFIIGHYASAAAKSALPFYQHQKVPVFLPAATSDQLTQSFNCAFRTCGKDSDLAAFVTAEFESKERTNFFIDHDKSEHGKKLSTLIKNALATADSVNITAHLNNADKVIYVGNFTNSVSFLKNNTAILSRIDEVYFTDDVVHPALPGAINFFNGKVSVFGYANSKEVKTAAAIVSRYHQQWDEYPFTYFLETYAALEVIRQLLALEDTVTNRIDALRLHTWETVLGNISFDENGECGSKRFAKWSVQGKELNTVRNYFD